MCSETDVDWGGRQVETEDAAHMQTARKRCRKTIQRKRRERGGRDRAWIACREVVVNRSLKHVSRRNEKVVMLCCG